MLHSPTLLKMIPLTGSIIVFTSKCLILIDQKIFSRLSWKTTEIQYFYCWEAEIRGQVKQRLFHEDLILKSVVD